MRRVNLEGQARVPVPTAAWKAGSPFRSARAGRQAAKNPSEIAHERGDAFFEEDGLETPRFAPGSAGGRANCPDSRESDSLCTNVREKGARRGGIFGRIAFTPPSRTYSIVKCSRGRSG